MNCAYMVYKICMHLYSKRSRFYNGIDGEISDAASMYGSSEDMKLEIGCIHTIAKFFMADQKYRLRVIEIV